MDFQEIIAGTVGKQNTFGTCVGRVKAAPMSFARFSTDDCNGRMRGYVGEGEFTDDPLETFGGAGVVEIPQHAGTAALHLRERLRASRGGEPAPSQPASVLRSGDRKYLGLGHVLAPIAAAEHGNHGNRRRRRFRHAERARLHLSTARRAGSARASPSIRCTARRTIRTTPRRATPTTCRRWSTATRKALAAAGVDGKDDRGHRARHHRIERDPGGRRISSRSTITTCGATTAPGTKRRRSPTRARVADCEAIEWCGGVYSSEWGFVEAAALAAAQSREARAHGHRARALRHGGGGALRHHRSGAGAAQHLRHGPQMDVERVARRTAAGGVPDRGRSAARRRSRQARRALSRPRDQIAGHALAGVGRASSDCAPGIPIPVGAFDAHWDAIGAGVPRSATSSTWSAPPPASWRSRTSRR